MVNMTVTRYEQLRKTVLDFIQFKFNHIDLLKWNYADIFTILSVFREYFEQLPYERRKIVFFLINTVDRYFFFQVRRKHGENHYTHSIQ